MEKQGPTDPSIPPSDPLPLAVRDWRPWVIGWLLLVGLCVLIDPWVFHLVDEHFGRIDKTQWTPVIVRWYGIYWTTLVIALFLWVFHPLKWQAGGFVCLSGITGGLFYVLLKWMIGRMRPSYGQPYVLHPFKGGLMALFKSPQGMAFPSGHTTLAFATAMSLSMLMPKWWWLFFIPAVLLGFERVGEDTHYLSDVIAGAGLGMVSAHLTRWGASRVITRLESRKSVS